MLRTSKPLIFILGREILPRVGLFVPLSLPVARLVQSRFLWPPEYPVPSSSAFPFPLEEWLRRWSLCLPGGVLGLTAGGGVGFITTLALCSLGDGKKGVVGQVICPLLLGTGAWSQPAVWGWTLLIWPEV